MTGRALESSLANVEAFCRAYEQGSFTRAAGLLGITPQAASRAVGRLEARLGVTLLRRTTRSVEATDAGRAYYEACRQALALIETGERLVAGAAGDERGTVRVSVPTTWGHHRFLPALARFRRLHPGINVLVQIDNRNVDFVREGFDLAIRMGEVRDQTLVARKLGDFALGVFASPSYLAERPAPASPDDLARHACVGFVLPSTGRVLPWRFGGGREITPPPGLRVAGDVLGAITLARAGAGLVQIYDFLVEGELDRGELGEVLAPFRGASRPFSLLYPQGVVQSRAVRRLVAFLMDERAAPPGREG
jgi:DNA-binding transcriptional LysR family regulator